MDITASRLGRLTRATTTAAADGAQSIPPDRVLDEFKYEGERALKALGILTLAGVVGIVVFSLSFVPPQSRVSIATGGTMISGASLLVGGLLGFLFGIPRAPQVNAAVEEASVPGGTVSSGRISTTGEGNPYRANTNLEEISDWLTKILVGVGLTQIAQLPDVVNAVATGVGPALGGSPASGVFGVAATLYYLVCGFLLSYLWTRVYLPRAFRWSDAFTALTQQLGGLSQQAELDRQALEIVGNQLNLETPQSANAEAEITAALKGAQSPARKLTFYQALHWLEKNTGPDGDKSQIARTIPIWRALIAVDDERKYYRNPYQLALALALSEPPNLVEAEQAINSAIAMRDANGVTDWRIFELQRARFVIQQDPDFRAQRGSSPAQRMRIENDLRAAEADPSVGQLVAQTPEVVAWRALQQANTPLSPPSSPDANSSPPPPDNP